MAEKEFIEREATIKIQCVDCGNYGFCDNDCSAVESIKRVPTADVWEVVHCVDCIHAEESLVSGCVYCNEMERARIKEGFCAWGERKTDDG